MTLLLDLARETGLSAKDVRRLVATAPRRYMVFTIPKRNGDERTIAQPAAEIKALQRILMMRVLAQLPVHESAYAYVKGKSIRANALRHIDSTHILKLDFENFFNSIRPVDLERVLLKRTLDNISPNEFEYIYNLTFWGMGTFNPRCLSIGAPSSPMISNIVMFDFDQRAMEIAAELKVTYTRYADDITVSSSSGSSPLIKFEKKVSSIIQSSALGLTLNEAKRGMYGRGDRRMVTGLIITPDGDISIGRERKRTIRSALHNLVLTPEDDVLLMWCKGMLAFVMSAEPSFMKSLYKRYGGDFIRSVVRAPNVSFYSEEGLGMG